MASCISIVCTLHGLLEIRSNERRECNRNEHWSFFPRVFDSALFVLNWKTATGIYFSCKLIVNTKIHPIRVCMRDKFDLFSLANEMKCIIKVNGKFIWPKYRFVRSICNSVDVFFPFFSRMRSTCRNLQMNESFKEKFEVCCLIEMNDAHWSLMRMHSYTKWRVQLNRLAFYAQMTCKEGKMVISNKIRMN